jgi:hypothetical protein
VASAWVSLASSEFHTEFMPQRAEDARVRKSMSGCAGDLLHDAAGDDVVGVGVLPLRAGLEVERLFGPGVEDLLGGLGGSMGVIT